MKIIYHLKDFIKEGFGDHHNFCYKEHAKENSPIVRRSFLRVASTSPQFKKYKRKKCLEYIMSDKERLKKTNLTLLLVITGIVGVFLSGNNSYGFYLIGFSTGGILGFLRSDT